MAPQALRRDRAAVTSVLGVFLVVIISIALGAAVWFMVHQVQRSHEVGTNSIKVVFRLNNGDTAHQLTVVKVVPENLDWVNDLALTGTCHPTLNGAAFPTAAGSKILAGDTLAGCARGQTLQVASSAAHGSELLFSATF
jgi:hypothetical protein